MITGRGQPLRAFGFLGGWRLNSRLIASIQWGARSCLLCLLLLWGGSVLGASFRYAGGDSSGKAPRIYLTGPGAATLSDIKTALPKVALTEIAPAIWHLKVDLEMNDGATLVLHGTKIGGDVNELRLKSNNDPLNPDDVVSITADWGAIDIRSTFITSWDDQVNGPDTEYTTYRRAFIRVRSFLGNDGATPYESRMDITDSEISHLGSHNAESYGLTWKVNPPKNNPGYSPITNLYNLVNVYGDIKNSHIHNNFFGVYTFGAYGMQMANNEVDHNVWYGFDPHDDSDALVIENNNVHHNGTHGIIASQRCDHLIIRNNISWSNQRCGIMLHRYDTDSLIEGNRCMNNGDSGIALFATSRDTVRSNICLGNVASGIRCSVGASDNLIENNEFGNGAAFGFNLYRGDDPPAPGDDGHPRRNRFLNNLVHDNAGNGILVTTADDNLFMGNRFQANAGSLLFVNGLRNILDSNSIPPGVTIQCQGSPSAAATTLIRHQAAVSVQVDAYSSVAFDDPQGLVFDPEEGGINNTLTPAGTTLSLTSAQIGKTSTVFQRNLQVLPNAGIALVAISIWNTSGDLGKRWTVQAGSATRSISYRVGDLIPNTTYNLLKNGVVTRVTTDSSGFVTFQDLAVQTGSVEYVIMHL